MKFRFVILLFLSGKIISFSQTLTQTIRGTVVDADSKSPLIGAIVTVINADSAGKSKMGETDLEGKFRVEKILVGRHAVKASLMGYEEVTLNNIVASSGKEVVLQIEMRENVITAKEVEIIYVRDKTKANNELITNSSRAFVSEETERYAGSRGDPSKMAANFAGVATGNDARNDIIVRGNSPLGVLWKLEGVEIPNPNHFSAQGATGGPVSILNNNLLGNSDFLTGAFPSEYGNKMAAVFDIKIRKGNNEKHEFTGQLGFNGLEFGAEGPISKKTGSSYLVNYRYSTLELFQLAGISFGVSALPKYQDACFKFHVPTKKAGVFTLWGIGGKSRIELLDSEKDSTDWSFTDKGEDLIFGSDMGAVGLSHLFFFNDKISGKLSLSTSASRFIIVLDTLSAAKIPYRTYENKSVDGQAVANYVVTNKINSRHLLKAGVSYNNLFFDYHAYYWSRHNNIYVDQLKVKDDAGMVQSFVHWQYRVTDKLMFNTGFHYQNFLLNNTQAAEPRAGMRWQFFPKHSLSAAYGMHSQMQPLIYYFFNSYDSASATLTASNRNLDLSKSRHYVLGYDYNFAKDYRLKIETYYQSLYNIPVEKNYKSSFSIINIGNDLEGLPLVDSLENKGAGFNYGTELTIEKFFSKGFYFLNTLSLYESKYKASDGIERNTAFSGGYVYNSLAGVEIPLGKSKNKFIMFDMKATFAGGNRYTPIDIAQSNIEKETVYVDSLAWSKKFKNYSKVDVKLSFRLNSKRASQYIFAHVENVFGTKNILRQIYDSSKNEIITEYQLGLFPYAGYRIEF